MPSCNTYRLTWVSLTLDEVYLLTDIPPDLERGIAPLGPPASAQSPLLGCGVAPPHRHPWPWTWGSSSQLLLRHHSLALSAAAPDLGHGVAPLGHVSAYFTLIFGGLQKSWQMVLAAMKLKDTYILKGKL